jgi:DNA-binding LacI/PurR family transcriptional regulator
MAKIVDVARLAGVSPASVSRFLNNQQVLKEETAQRIKAAVETLQYYPNPIAVGLRTKRTNMIAFVIPTLSNLYYIDIYRELHKACTKEGYMLCIHSTEGSKELLSEIIESISEYQYAGVIISYLDEPDVTEKLASLQKRLPLVLITTDIEKKSFSTVQMDVESAMYEATKYLIDADKRRIAFAGGGSRSPITVEGKMTGYFTALRDAGIKPRQDYIFYKKGDHTLTGVAAGQAAAKELMNLTEPPQAVVCTVDDVAVGFIKYLKENHYRVPEDFSVIGFNGIFLADVYEPEVTTMAQPFHEMAEAAFALLQEQIKNPDSAKEQRPFHAKLKIQKST